MIPFRPHHAWFVQALLLLWRWLPELVLVAAACWYWTSTGNAGWATWVQVLVPVLVLAALLAWPWSRRWLLGMAWLLVTRHRLRTYFLQCGAYNRSGRLPWLTLSWPTPVGERVWVWLVPGLSLADFESDTAQIAVACWARDTRVGRSKRLAGLVWVDVIRRDPLTGTVPHPSALLNTATPVPTPLLDTETSGQDQVPVAAETPLAPAPSRLLRVDGPLDVPRTVIDLDAARENTGSAAANNGSGARTGGRTGKPAARTTTAAGTTTAHGDGIAVPRVVGRGGEDVSDWL